MLKDADLPALFVAADIAAARAQKLLFRLTAALLVLSFIAAIFGSFEIEHGGRNWAAIGSLVTLLGGLAATSVLSRRDPNKRWYDLRALAESVKSLSWMWAAGGGDFGISKRPEDAARTDFTGRLKDLQIHLGAAVARLEQAPVATTKPMDDLRGSDLSARRHAYGQGRVGDQLAWYQRRAREHDNGRRLWSAASFLLQSAGVAFALLRFFEVVHVDLVGIATTAAVAAAAWLRGHDHAGVAEAYRQTALELAEIQSTLDQPKGEAEWANWVMSAETAMSREHTSWRARRRRLLQ